MALLSVIRDFGAHVMVVEVDGQINSFSAALNSGEGVVMPRVKGSGVILIRVLYRKKNHGC